MKAQSFKLFIAIGVGIGSLCMALAVSPGRATEVAAVSETMAHQLAPKSEHRYASRWATRIINAYRYGEKADEDLSERMFDQYLDLLDGNRLYFTATDIADLERYRPHLHESLKSADLEPAFDIFNRYVKRVNERTSHALELLDRGFDFTIDEEYRFDRTELPWAASEEELEEVWRQRVKNDWLLLKLTDQEDEEIAETLRERYTNLDRRISEFNSEDVFQFFMNAYTRSIEPHSAYLSPRSVDNFEISMRLSLDGIGAMLQRETEYTTVMEVVPGGPADLDGRLQAGDRIVAVAQGDEDFVDVIGWRLDDVVSLIRGERETVVRLEVLPAETGLSGPSQVIDIVRDEVKLEEQAASSEIIEVPEGDEVRRIGVINLPVFYVDFQGRARNEPNYRSSTRDTRHLINELREQDIDGLVIDLRGNGGGALIEATTLTGLFIDEGPVVQVRDFRGRINLERDREPGMAWDGPLAVLVDRRSASASEIFAAAIQDYGRGVVIGETTFGKGTVQNLIDLDQYSNSDDTRLGQIKLTMAQFYRVNGGSTQRMGVIPDILLPTAGDPEETGESALENALPWGEIEATEFDQVAHLESLVELARQRHEQRLESDEELQDLLAEIRDFEAEIDRHSVTLLESARRAEMEEEEERRSERYASVEESATDGGEDVLSDAAGNEDSEDEASRDLYLIETARILSDLIALDGDQHRMAHRGDESLSAGELP
ncbi:carboxy terminal-processing peptidase [Wenzhouxiangella marina]|uniref:Peptidase S41 n=1 Tax=Wenzhouxiangella marina TaxID=1579979 RepID=A0A0K0XSI9_9GAMM|nr:carboxy terminal-processing peptidase [Wenzhouxiangella marina]AKS40625.1 peptidase S41 [Wenzhouxiangella marina]MBB6088393.1 carboxyl-terminal processing protease [Wenzhouxiangella marina]